MDLVSCLPAAAKVTYYESEWDGTMRITIVEFTNLPDTARKHGDQSIFHMPKKTLIERWKQQKDES